MNKVNNTIEKVVVNSSFGKLATNAPDFEGKLLPDIEQQFAAITGQKGQQRPARISISGFKLRAGIIVGLKSTLRGSRAKQFVDRTVTIVMPRIRDFHGIKRSGVDRDGNLTFGVKEHTVYPEIVLEKVRAPLGLEVTIVPKQRMNREEALEFYKKLGIPFEKEVTANKKK
jgi:large subunit ribosomal protein L5